MIYHNIKIHDSNSIELKYWFHIDQSDKESHFEVNMWFVSPSSLEVTSESYSRVQFYSNIKSNFRLITPTYSLNEIISSDNSPLYYLNTSVEKFNKLIDSTTISNFEYHVKMFTSIFKSAIRNKNTSSAVIDDVRAILNTYRNIKDILLSFQKKEKETELKLILKIFKNGDEYITFLANKWAFSEYQFHKELLSFIKEQNEYKKQMGYQMASQTDMDANSKLLYRWGTLKKLNSNQLYFGLNTKKDGIIAEQFYYSLAAGLSMIFATIIAFSFQIKYGNFTIPLFFALVVSYMLKDRIKDIMRYYFAHKKRKKYFDNKTSILLYNKKVGTSREAFDFIANKSVPKFIKDSVEIRNYYVSLYRKYVTIDNIEINSNSEYNIEGMNNIVRRNISNYLKNMDNAVEKLYFMNDNNEVEILMADRIYYFFMVIETKEQDKINYTKYKIKANRLGLISVQLLPNDDNL